MMAAGSAIEVDDLLIRYGSLVAVDGMSVQIEGRVIGLLGPNGAGKSTLIRCLLGLIKPERGRVTVAGLDVSADVMSVRDRVGYMPEHDCLIESMSAVALVSYMGRMSGMCRKDAVPRAHEVLDFVGIAEERYRTIASYSTGMKQRVKLAQAIVHDPDMLFLDEPTNGMDPVGREDMLRLIGRIGSAGRTILISSHILSDVERVSDYVVIMEQGRLVAEGALEELLMEDLGVTRLMVRGDRTALEHFVDRLDGLGELMHVDVLEGEAHLLIKGLDDTGAALEAAATLGVQIRSLGPEKPSLEDVFIKKMGGGQ